MSKFDKILETIIKNPPHNKTQYNRIFVVSAYSGVTNMLLEHKQTKQEGIYAKFKNEKDFSHAMIELKNKLIVINESLQPIGLDVKKANQYITRCLHKVTDYLNHLRNILSLGYFDQQELLLSAREILASIGESHSAFNSVLILNENGIRAKLIDLSSLEDSRPLTIDKRIQDALQDIQPKKYIYIITGYTKGIDGIMRQFDRGYSEVTFSKVAVFMKAKEAIIHKEYHLSTADPKIVGVDKAHPVQFTNFDVADQLADVGMEAIHPHASKPLEHKNIPIRVKNAFEPHHPGTLITKNYINKLPVIEVVAGTNKVVALQIHDADMVGIYGFERKIIDIFIKHKISYILHTTNANSITYVLQEQDCNKMLLRELEKEYSLIEVKNVSLVCVIGSNINKPGFLSLATNALYQQRINILAVAQTLRQVNIQFVVERKDYKKTIIVLNDFFCQGTERKNTFN